MMTLTLYLTISLPLALHVADGESRNIRPVVLQGNALEEVLKATRLPFSKKDQLFILSMKDEEENRFSLYLRDDPERRAVAIGVPVGQIGDETAASIIREVTDKVVVQGPWKKLQQSGVSVEIALGSALSLEPNRILVFVTLPANRLYEGELAARAKDLRQILEKTIAVASVAKAAVELVRK
ncbi:MAG: hypothetical protein ABDH66_00440 [Bacteroidia bacterium]